MARAFLRIHIDNNNPLYLGYRRTSALISEIIEFHYNPSSIKKSYNPVYEKANNQTPNGREQYKRTDPLTISLQLFFSDWMYEDYPLYTPSRQVQEQLADRERYFRSSDPRLFQLLRNPIQHRKDVNETLDLLRALTKQLPCARPTRHGNSVSSPPPAVELVGVEPTMFIGYVKKMKIKIIAWEPEIHRPIRAMVDIVLREKIRSGGLLATTGDNGRHYYEFVEAIPNRRVVSPRLTRTGTGGGS